MAGNIQKPHILDSAVSTSKLADGAVMAGKLASGAVTIDKAADDLKNFILDQSALRFDNIGDLVDTFNSADKTAYNPGRIIVATKNTNNTRQQILTVQRVFGTSIPYIFTGVTSFYSDIKTASSSMIRIGYYGIGVPDVDLNDYCTEDEIEAMLEGYAEIVNGKVPSYLLPSYVDDVLEGELTANGFILSGESSVCTPESGKIYVDTNTQICYRWGGELVGYVEISQSLALGETASTAYAGNKGKQNADNIALLQANKANSADVYTKTQVDTALGNKADAADVDSIINADFDVISSYNRYNPGTAKDGRYVNEANGGLLSNENYIASDYIEIQKDHKYAFKSSNHWAVYDDAKTFITAPQTENVNDYIYFVAAFDGFLRFSSSKTNSRSMQFFEVGDKTQVSYLPYQKANYVNDFYYDNKIIPRETKEDFGVYLYNLMDSTKIKTGYYFDTANASYDTTDFLPLPSVSLTVFNESLVQVSIRRVAYYDRDHTQIYSVENTNGILSETPTFVDAVYFRYSLPTGTIARTMPYPSNVTPIKFLDYGKRLLRESYIDPYLSASDAKVEAIQGTAGLVTKAASLTNGTKLQLSRFPEHLKKNIALTSDMKFNSFTGVKIGMGYNAYRGDWLEIDSTNVVYKHYESSASTESTVAHGLTIADDLSLVLYIDNDGVCNISMATNGGNTNISIQWKFEQNGTPFVLGSQDMTDVKLSAVAMDAKCPVWIFGDSYFGFAENRVMGQLKNLGYTDNILVDGMAGIGTSACLTDLTRLIAMGGSPKIVICCEGMNDNASGYETNLGGIISACESCGAELVLYKVPVVSVRLAENTGVNSVALASGKRYIDAYRAVGADVSGNWWSGYNEDGVHPTVIGAKAIAQRIIIDVPEIMQYGRNTGNVTGNITGDI